MVQKNIKYTNVDTKMHKNLQNYTKKPTRTECLALIKCFAAPHELVHELVVRRRGMHQVVSTRDCNIHDAQEVLERLPARYRLVRRQRRVRLAYQHVIRQAKKTPKIISVMCCRTDKFD